MNYFCVMSSLLIRSARLLVQAGTEGKSIAKGAQMAQLPLIENGWVLCDGDRIAAVGTMDTCPERADRIIDAAGRMVFPSWCDSHTHIVFAASREEEFVYRIKGMTYEEIAEKGGGILHSALKLQATSEEELYEGAWGRLMEIIRYGTGAVEIKSGYGLSVESELKMLRVIRRLKENSPIPIKATFLGAHAVPKDYRGQREAYIDLILNTMLPQIVEEGLADYFDVFCDRGYFTPEETDRMLKVALRYGLKGKIHANELGITGGVQVGVANGALSVDHLEYCGPEELDCLAGGDTIPTLLPSCAFFLGLPYGPARAMIDRGLPVTLATDYNPGSTPSGKMPFVVSLACIKMKMLPEEAIQAATLNGACAMELQHELGTITPGKRANLFVTRPVPSVAYLPYAFGSDIIETVILNGAPFPA